MEIDFCPRWILAKLRIPERSQNHFRHTDFHPGNSAAGSTCAPRAPLLPDEKAAGDSVPWMWHFTFGDRGFQFDLAKAWLANPAGIAVAMLFSFQIVARPIAMALPQAARTVSSISQYGSNFSVIVLFPVWAYRVL